MRDTPRTPVQEAIIKLRKALGGISQQELAVRMGKAVVSVARWETARAPSDLALLELRRLALEAGANEAASVFNEALPVELQRIDIPMSVEESVYCDALLRVLRNRQLEGMAQVCRHIVSAIHSGLETLLESGGESKRLQGNINEIRNELENVGLLLEDLGK